MYIIIIKLFNIARHNTRENIVPVIISMAYRNTYYIVVVVRCHRRHTLNYKICEARRFYIACVCILKPEGRGMNEKEFIEMCVYYGTRRLGISHIYINIYTHIGNKNKNFSRLFFFFYPYKKRSLLLKYTIYYYQ